MDALDIIKMIPFRTKHGPGRNGGSGKCAEDCLKCIAQKWLDDNTRAQQDEALDFKHCDDYIHDPAAPPCLRFFLLVHRLPAVDGALLSMHGVKPKLFADHHGHRVRVVMASRFGDVGITSNLDAESGYETRVPLSELSNFSQES